MTRPAAGRTGVAGAGGGARSGVLTGVPGRLARALEALRRWRERGVHLVGVRHHSPGCSLALTALLEEVRPRAVLIEGPAEYASVLTELQDTRTVPPVAVLSLDGQGACYYPLAECSPEWVALRWAGEHGATTSFIDRPAASRAPREDRVLVRTLQAESHLARSASVAALARRLGCRDHDEVWEHLFEDRATRRLHDWRAFFADTLAWAGLTRLDAAHEVLDADGTHAREAVMAEAVAGAVAGPPRQEPARHASRTAAGASGASRPGVGPVVVVTGAFHTMALLEALDGAPEAAWLPPAEPGSGSRCWLIRYDLASLDSLRGYEAGMPSPGFWIRAWRARRGGSGPEVLATEVVLDVASRLRTMGEPLGTAQVTTTVGQALGLAALRGRAWPGRTDLLDALSSCLVKDDTGLSGALGAAVASVLAASGTGEIPPGTASPPLVADVRQQARALRLDLSDSTERRTSLDTARRPGHRRRREFLARMRFVGTGFARQVGGADLLTGANLGQLREEWAYAWTPLVESALVRASHEAPTLEALVLVRLAQRLDGEPTASELVALLTEVVVMGLGGQVQQVCDLLETRLAAAGELGSLTESLHGLASLAESTGRLDATAVSARARTLIDRGVAAAAYLVPGLAGLDAASLPAAVDALVSLRDLLTRLDPQDAGRQTVLRALEVLRRDPAAPALLVGACTGIAASTGGLGRQEATSVLTAHLAGGADSDRVADFLVGLVRTSPDIVLYGRDTLAEVTRALTALDETGFLAVLPDLRRAFTTLRPAETLRLAERVAEMTGTEAADIDVVEAVEPRLAEAGLRLDHDLAAGLERDGLGAWTGRGCGAGGAGSATPVDESDRGTASPLTPPEAEEPGEEAAGGAAGRVPGDAEADPSGEGSGTGDLGLDRLQAARRWRLVLGRYAEKPLPCRYQDLGLDGTLGLLYDREYAARGHRLVGRSGQEVGSGPGSPDTGGTLDPSVLRAVDWLDEVRSLFPVSAVERLEHDALTRYGLTGLLEDPSAVESIETSPALGAALLRIKGTVPPRLADGVRALVAKVVAEILARLRPALTTTLTGTRQRHRRSPRASARNLDWRGTIAANLGQVDPATGRMLVEEVRFVARQSRIRLGWEVIILLDQSGSMAGSVLHSAVMASILAALPGVTVRLVLFDTSVVDLTHMVHDPVEVLMTSQLGGGTDIAQAVAYAAQQVRQPTRTVLALVSDLDEGGSVSSLLRHVRGLVSSGVRVLGLGSLTDDGRAWLNRDVADRLAGAGARVGAMTPDRFAEWLAEVMS